MGRDAAAATTWRVRGSRRRRGDDVESPRTRRGFESARPRRSDSTGASRVDAETRRAPRRQQTRETRLDANGPLTGERRLRYGQAQTITDDRGATKERVRLAEPVDGWLSAKMVAAATADAAPSMAVQSTPEAAAPLARELEVAVSLARRAGAEIVRLRASGELNPTEKPNDEGPVTAADFAADRLISDGLREAFPGDCVVSEEGGECATDGDRAWCFCRANDISDA